MSNITPANGYYVVDLRSLKLSDADHRKIEAAIKSAVLQNLSAAPGAPAITFAPPPGGIAGAQSQAGAGGPSHS